MSTTFTTKPLQQLTSGAKSEAVVIFYLLTFCIGGLFLFGGGRLGFAIELIAAMLYVSVTALFYAVTKGSSDVRVGRSR
jgi:hypothetical protein